MINNQLIQLAKECPSIKIEVSAKDLSEFAEQILIGAKAIYEKPEKPEQYLNRKQTAQMLDVDLSTLWRWNKENYLHTIMIGGKVRYKLSDVERILNGQKSCL